MLTHQVVGPAVDDCAVCFPVDISELPHDTCAIDSSTGSENTNSDIVELKTHRHTSTTTVSFSILNGSQREARGSCPTNPGIFLI